MQVCPQERYKITIKKGVTTRKALKKMWYFPLTPRLKRLFASETTARWMTYHHNRPRIEGKLIHPSDGEAWKHFDRVHPEFAQEPRNVRLGLCADGFNPFGQSGGNYSCWPIIVTPYNLPPDMCMRREVMFLTALIPGDKHPGAKIDVFLQSLIDELEDLWNVGAPGTYDIANKNHFDMREALI